MSIRAYKILEIKREENSTFNLWQDGKLCDFLNKEDHIDMNLNENGGLIDVSVETLERAIKELDLDEDLKQSLQKDIDWAGREKTDYIQYLCL